MAGSARCDCDEWALEGPGRVALMPFSIALPRRIGGLG
jgi:hypothetical protein